MPTGGQGNISMPIGTAGTSTVVRQKVCCGMDPSNTRVTVLKLQALRPDPRTRLASIRALDSLYSVRTKHWMLVITGNDGLASRTRDSLQRSDCHLLLLLSGVVSTQDNDEMSNNIPSTMLGPTSANERSPEAQLAVTVVQSIVAGTRSDDAPDALRPTLLAQWSDSRPSAVTATLRRHPKPRGQTSRFSSHYAWHAGRRQ
ncbi:uncharacterized protein C8Q71DRAFT_48654 [Rhodofomes roseus]|uniref:Uncharacterized protein n=1 Tax=Rhodofomes roseus TaxID=34475 RepID=A0ABQ8KFL5_9APHY|nr:uncharacterized protein C8Q71DRAFT_48654 [Rhodofomes roseus]KAH9836576.1 hypothetical protein C8Q71DRAFT_48654 [Rhodofomes roseus]